MNFFDGTLTDMQGKPVVDLGFYKYGPNDFTECAKRSATGPEVVLGVRPENFRLSKEKLPNSFEAQVHVVEPIGDSTIVDLKVDDQILKVTVRGSYKASTGEKLYVTPGEMKCHIFDKKTTSLIA